MRTRESGSAAARWLPATPPLAKLPLPWKEGRSPEGYTAEATAAPLDCDQGGERFASQKLLQWLRLTIRLAFNRKECSTPPRTQELPRWLTGLRDHGRTAVRIACPPRFGKL